MIYVKINDTLYPATITGEEKDWNWGERPSKSITVEMSHAEANALCKIRYNAPVLYGHMNK